MNKASWKRRLEQDLSAMGLSSTWKFHYVISNRIAWFVCILRIVEHKRTQRGLLSRISYYSMRFYYDRLSERLGFDIPLGVFGGGLSIAHRGTIVVNGQARIGRNCRIHPGVTIGGSNGEAPVIGNDVFIGPGAGIYGGVTIGEGAVIGPHSLITVDVPANTTTISGRAEVRSRRGSVWNHPDSDLGPTVKLGKTSAE